MRSDGSGLRRLDNPSRERCFRTGPDPTNTFIFTVNLVPDLPFSPNGRRIVFTDLGPGPGGEEAVQIIVLDLAIDPPTRTQVTHLSSFSPPGPLSFSTAYPTFIDDETIQFFTLVDPDGSNPTHDFAAFTVRIDGRGLKRKLFDFPPDATTGGRIIPVFGTTRLATDVFDVSVHGIPENPTAEGNSISEIVVLLGRKNFLSLTNFRRVDTTSRFLSGTRRRAFFTASADPFGTNPSGTCQLFSVGTLGSGLRQVTHFNNNPGSPATQPACWTLDSPPACRLGGWGLVQDPVTKAVVFEASCDPFATNPFGDQVFAMHPDGRGLRQLTDAAGFTTDPDGSIRVELPGPFAYSAHF